MSHLYIALAVIVPLALILSLASYVSLRRTYTIEDLPPLEGDR